MIAVYSLCTRRILVILHLVGCIRDTFSNFKWAKPSLVKFLALGDILTMIFIEIFLGYVKVLSQSEAISVNVGSSAFLPKSFDCGKNRFVWKRVRFPTQIVKFGVVVTCLIAGFSSGSHYGSEVANLCRILSSKVFVGCDRVEASKTYGFEVSYRILFRRVSFRLCSWDLYCEQKRSSGLRKTSGFRRR